MKIGLVARMDNSGLGSLSWEFARHLNPHKVLLVENGVYATFPERYKDYWSRKIPPRGTVEPADVYWLLEDVDVVLSCETFYNWGIVQVARQKGVKTALYTMYEMTPEKLPYYPSLFICPSTLDLKTFRKEYAGAPAIHIQAPVATDRLKWKERTTAKRFVHTASHGGVAGRKGTSLLIKAMEYVESDIELDIYSWQEFIVDDPRVTIHTKNFKNYWQCWREGDVLIYPQDYNGISLPVQEAFSSGLGVLSTNIEPFNEYLPKRLLFEPESMTRLSAGHELLQVDAAIIDPKTIAEKIDEVAFTDISKESHAGKRWAEENSWDVQTPKFIHALETLCESGPESLVESAPASSATSTH